MAKEKIFMSREEHQRQWREHIEKILEPMDYFVTKAEELALRIEAASVHFREHAQDFDASCAQD